MYYVVLGLLCESITSYFYYMKYFVKNIFKRKKKTNTNIGQQRKCKFKNIKNFVRWATNNNFPYSLLFTFLYI